MYKILFRVKIEELDQMLDKNSATMPYIKSQPETFFFGQSSSTSTTTGPDGVCSPLH